MIHLYIITTSRIKKWKQQQKNKKKMNKIYFKNLNNYLEKKIVVKGFVKNLRKTKSICFLILTDSTGDLQVVVDSKNKFPEFNPHIGSCVCVEGTLVKNDAVKLNGMELIPDKIEILSTAELYPIDSNSDIWRSIFCIWVFEASDKRPSLTLLR